MNLFTFILNIEFAINITLVQLILTPYHKVNIFNIYIQVSGHKSLQQVWQRILK